MEELAVEPREIPACPKCHNKSWKVGQVIRRDSELIAVDSLNDLVVANYDIDGYEQQLTLQCFECGQMFMPALGTTAIRENALRREEANLGQIEAYQQSAEDGGNINAWPERVRNLDEILEAE